MAAWSTHTGARWYDGKFIERQSSLSVPEEHRQSSRAAAADDADEDESDNDDEACKENDNNSSATGSSRIHTPVAVDRRGVCGCGRYQGGAVKLGRRAAAEQRAAERKTTNSATSVRCQAHIA